MARKVIIMGAAGKDFHVFNTIYRGRKTEEEVVAFTATQIPGIDDRRYPASLAGDGYPNGIPIEPEDSLPALIKEHAVDHVVFAYSDVRYDYVDGKRRLVEEAGASFETAPVEPTMLKSSKPVVAVCAVRTGVGKSQTTRYVSKVLQGLGKKVVACRHPMPYGDLAAQRVQRYASLEDLKKHHCTIEEMEEYEPHIVRGTIVYAGVDYEAILREAEKEADVILWDGGNNDTPFYRPDIMITVADPHRAGHETGYYPGETNFRMADVILINKVDTANNADVDAIRESIRRLNPDATVIEAASPISVEDPGLIAGKRALVVEDGPTLTHGGMKYGAGVVAAEKFGASELVDPRPYTTGKITRTFERYPGIGTLLPAMGYGEEQVKDLEETINRTDCDVVVIGTPIDLRRVIDIRHPSVRVTYDLQEIGHPDLHEVLKPVL